MIWTNKNIETITMELNKIYIRFLFQQEEYEIPIHVRKFIRKYEWIPDSKNLQNCL